MGDGEDTVGFSAPRCALVNFDNPHSAAAGVLEEPLFADLSRVIFTADVTLPRTLVL